MDLVLSYIIFLVSSIGIWSICYTLLNYNEVYNTKDNLTIILTKYDVDNVERKEIISKLYSKDFDEFLNIMDNVRIN